jgi:subtilisin family serine protease
MDGFKLKSLYFIFIIIAFIIVDTGSAKAVYREGELLIRLNTAVLSETNAQKNELLSSMNVKVKKHYNLNQLYLIQIPENESVIHALKRLRHFKSLDIVEPNYIRHAKIFPNDPLFDNQYYHRTIQSQRAWDITSGSSSMQIAVIDSGIDYNHGDILNNIWKNLNEDWKHGSPEHNGIDDDGDGYIDNYYGINTIDNSGNTMDILGHGTHVAGIIGAVGNNEIGIAGINFNVSLMALKIIDDEGNGTVADEIEAIEYARKNNIRIMNMSFGGYDYSEIEKSTIESSTDILFIASAGNEKNNNDRNPLYPASYAASNMISVAASDANDDLASFSNFGIRSVDIAAPGVNILSTFPGDRYESISGTSMSAPIVTGLAGLILTSNSGLTPVQVKDRILRTSDQVQGLHDKILTGGRINAYQSLITVIEGPHIYRIYPDKGRIGSQIAIYGSEFDSQPGRVVFNENKDANIISWKRDVIMANVPDGITSGPVTVVTNAGISNGNDFMVTEFPSEMKISFPHLVRTENSDPVVAISNPQNRDISVSMKFISSDCGITTQKSIVLNPFEIKIVSSIVYDEGCYSYILVCQSNDFFGAVVLSREDASAPLIVMPHIIGGPFE